MDSFAGLDPPFVDDRDWTMGLNPTSADLVDVIHTNGESTGTVSYAGTMKALGHIDFYVNGGRLQPGCDEGVLYVDYFLRHVL